MTAMLLILLSLFDPGPVTPPEPATAKLPVVMYAAINDEGYAIRPNWWFTVGLRLQNTSDQPIDVMRMQLDVCSGGMFARFDSSPAVWQVWYQRNLGTCEGWWVRCESEHLAWALAWPNDPPHMEPAGVLWDYVDVGCITMRAPSEPGVYHFSLRMEPDEWWLSNYPCNGTWVQDAYSGLNVLERIEPEVLTLIVVGD